MRQGKAMYCVSYAEFNRRIRHVIITTSYSVFNLTGNYLHANVFRPTFSSAFIKNTFNNVITLHICLLFEI